MSADHESTIGCNRKSEYILTYQPLEKKIENINIKENDTSTPNIPHLYNVGIQTIRYIIKNKSKLDDFGSQADSLKDTSVRKTLKQSTYDELDNAMAK